MIWKRLPQEGGINIGFPTLKDGSRDWCAICKHEDGYSCELGEKCMYQQNTDGTYNYDLPPIEYKEK